MGKCLNSAEITASVTACANLMAGRLSDDELNLLSAVLMQLADTLATISVVRAINAEKCKEVCEKEDAKENTQNTAKDSDKQEEPN